MSKSQNSFIKHQKALRKKKKQEEKKQKRLERKENKTDGSLENMMAFVDENGNLRDQPTDDPEPDPGAEK